MRTICLDARLYGIAHTGIGRYTENLIRFLPVNSSSHVLLIVSPENEHNSDLDKFEKVVARFHPYAIPAQFEMLWIWLKYRPILLHATHSSIPALWPGKFVVTFHDLIRHQSHGPGSTTQKHFFYWFKYLGYLLVDKIALWRSQAIIVPSHYWEKVLISQYRIPQSKIYVTYEGVDKSIKPGKKSDSFSIPKPFVVYTGNLYPHKNISVLLSAVKILQNKIHLVLVGSKSVFTQRAQNLIQEKKLTSQVTLLGRLSDIQLSNLYSQASAFVFPSLIEGFGLPGLEAMACGLPVIAANASCLPEIYQNAALYFDPHDPQDLANKIYKVITDSDLCKDLSRRGIDQAKKYSWAKMSQQTWEIYQTILP